MQIIISGRHFTVTDVMKTHVESKLAEILDKKCLKVTSVRVVLGLDKTRQVAEIIVNMKNADFETKAETYDMFQSIDEAVAKIAHQVNKYLDKAQDHRRDKSIRDVKSDEAEAE